MTNTGSPQRLLMLHGAEADHRMFDALIAELGDGVAAIAYDQRDCDAACASGEPYDLCDLADDAARVLDELGIDAAHAIGQSIGGVIAQLLAIRHPDRVDQLVLSSTFRAGSSLLDINPDGVRKLLELRAMGAPRELTAFFTTDAFAAAHSDAIHAIAPATTPAQRARRLQAITQPIGAVDIAAIKAPTLVIAGECDRVVPHEHARRLAADIPRARFELLPGVGHVSPLQAPRALAQRILTFLGSFR
jgi:pimeloyl-ACP methyl ester carboxylesterase